VRSGGERAAVVSGTGVTHDVLVAGRSRGADVVVVLGPYPFCEACRLTNGGLIAVKHRQIHLRAHGKESCVDAGLVGLLAALWSVCETRSCCEDSNGRAYVVPTSETREAAEQMLTALGLRWVNEEGFLFFRVPDSSRLSDIEYVQRLLGQPGGRIIHVRADEMGGFTVL
jgi:hypothetical protein